MTSVTRGCGADSRLGLGHLELSVTYVGVPAESRIQRAPLAESRSPGGERLDVRALAERVDHDAPDLAEVVLVEPAHGRRLAADAHARGDRRRPLVEGNGVPVRRHADRVQTLLRVLARPRGLAQVELEEVGVGSTRDEVDAAAEERLAEHVRVRTHLALVVAKAFGRRRSGSRSPSRR